MDDLQRFFEASDQMVERVAEGTVFRFVIPGPQAEDQPSVAYLIDGVRHLCDQRRVAEAGAGDNCAKLYFRRDRRQRGHMDQQSHPPALVSDGMP